MSDTTKTNLKYSLKKRCLELYLNIFEEIWQGPVIYPINFPDPPAVETDFVWALWVS